MVDEEETLQWHMLFPNNAMAWFLWIFTSTYHWITKRLPPPSSNIGLQSFLEGCLNIRHKHAGNSADTVSMVLDRNFILFLKSSSFQRFTLTFRMLRCNYSVENNVFSSVQCKHIFSNTTHPYVYTLAWYCILLWMWCKRKLRKKPLLCVHPTRFS